MAKQNMLFAGLFHDKEFYKKMLYITLPVMVQNFISSFLNLIDTVMVGRLGETEIAAVGIANQYFFLFNMFLIGLSAGCGVFIAQFWGKRDHRNIKRILGIGLVSVFFVFLLFMLIGFLFPEKVIALFNNELPVVKLGAGYLRIVLVSYLFAGVTSVYSFSLRSVGNAAQPMLISIIALVCNAFLNYVLIFGKMGAPALGVEGAALATVIARVVETSLLVGTVYLGQGVLAASLREMIDLSLEFARKSYQIILPVILNDIFWGLGSLVYMTVYGRMGTQAVAAVQICTTINNLFMVSIFGLSSAAAVMVGNSIGAGEEDLGKEYARRFSLLSVLAGLFLGLLLALTSPWMLDLFNVSSAVRNTSQIILYTISIIFFIRVFDIMLIVGILRGAGDARQALLIEGFTMWFVGVPLTILGAFVFRLPVQTVYALAILEEVAKCILVIIRLRSGKWINNVTEDMPGLLEK